MNGVIVNYQRRWYITSLYPHHGSLIMHSNVGSESGFSPLLCEAWGVRRWETGKMIKKCGCYEIRYNMIRPSLSKVRPLHKHKGRVWDGREKEGRCLSPKICYVRAVSGLALKVVHAMNLLLLLLTGILSFHC